MIRFLHHEIEEKQWNNIVMQSCADLIIENKLSPSGSDDEKDGDNIKPLSRDMYDQNLGDWIIEYANRKHPTCKI